MNTFDNQSTSIGCVGKLGYLFDFVRHYLLNIFATVDRIHAGFLAKGETSQFLDSEINGENHVRIECIDPLFINGG